MSKWIKCSERMPSPEECEGIWGYGWFLVWHSDFKRIELSRYDKHSGEHNYDHGWKDAWNDKVSHWMPLPKPPADDNPENC